MKTWPKRVSATVSHGQQYLQTRKKNVIDRERLRELELRRQEHLLVWLIDGEQGVTSEASMLEIEC
jgi:hypothetical protein